MASLLEAQRPTGDESSFDQLYRTYKGDVQRLAGRLLRNSADGEDATQTVFLNVLRALRQGVHPTEPKAWLLAITRNVCRSRQRAVACRPNEVELDPEQLTPPTNGDGPTTDDIVGALARMLPNQRTALILRDFRGGAPGEISELLGLTPVGVEALLARARASFREELEAGDQPFDCAETRELVRRQINGSITVGDRHSLKAHLRHCSPCAGAARSLRSSLGKLAGLVWPGGIVERFANLFTQLPTAHVAGAVTSTALVTSVAVPVALSPHKTVSHVTPPAARTAPVASHRSRSASESDSPPARSLPRTARDAVARHARAGRAAHARIAAAGAVTRRARSDVHPSPVHASNTATDRTRTTAPEAGSAVAAATSSPVVSQRTDAAPVERTSEPATRVRPGQPTQPTAGTPVRRSGRPNHSHGRRRGIVQPTQTDGPAPTTAPSSGAPAYGQAGVAPADSSAPSNPPSALDPASRKAPADPPPPPPAAAAPPAPNANGPSGSAGNPGASSPRHLR